MDIYVYGEPPILFAKEEGLVIEVGNRSIFIPQKEKIKEIINWLEWKLNTIWKEEKEDG